MHEQGLYVLRIVDERLRILIAEDLIMPLSVCNFLAYPYSRSTKMERTTISMALSARRGSSLSTSLQTGLTSPTDRYVETIGRGRIVGPDSSSKMRCPLADVDQHCTKLLPDNGAAYGHLLFEHAVPSHDERLLRCPGRQNNMQCASI